MDEVELQKEWERVLAEWDDPAAHKRFLVLADAAGDLGFAGRRYRAEKDRAAKEQDAARRVIAETRVAEILALAMSKMSVERSEPQKAKSRLEWIAFGVSAALIAAALWQVFRTM